MPIIDVTEYIQEGYLPEEYIAEFNDAEDADIFLDIVSEAAEFFSESTIGDIKKSVDNINDLRAQWKKYQNSFVRHKWIYRYVNEKQRDAIKKHYDVLCNEKTNYSTYKRSYAAMCKFFGLPGNVVIENIEFRKDKEDTDQDKVVCKYSKGVAKITIPDGINLIHATTADVGGALIPSFRSRVKGKYMYPNRRVFFTCIKEISPKKAGLEGQKTHKYTPKTPIKTAYIDPACTEFGLNAVYVETDAPIPVVDYYKSLADKVATKVARFFPANKKMAKSREEEESRE